MSVKTQNRMANSVYPDETAHYEPSHQDLHSLHRYLVWFAGLKGLNLFLRGLDSSNRFSAIFIQRRYHWGLVCFAAHRATRASQKVTSLSHFQLTETLMIFMPCFNTCFRAEGKIAPLSCHLLKRYWMSNMASDAKVSFSSKVEYRAVIRYMYLKGKTGQEIHCELTNVYGSSAPSYAQVKFWVGEFKRSRTSLEDETRSGTSDAIDEEMCNKVRDLVYSDRRIEVEEIANALHISHGSVSTTLHDRLGMHKLTARWVPKSLSDEQMATRESVYSALLKRFRSKEDDLLSRLVTVDETWVHYYEPENKAQSRHSRRGLRGQRSSKRKPLLARWWQLYFGMHKALLCWTF